MIHNPYINQIKIIFNHAYRTSKLCKIEEPTLFLDFSPQFFKSYFHGQCINDVSGRGKLQMSLINDHSITY